MGIYSGSHSLKIDSVLIVATFCLGVFQLKKSSGQKDTDANLDGKANPIEQEESAAMSEDDNLEYHEEAGDIESNIDEISHHVSTTMNVGNGGLASKSGKPLESSAKLDMQNSVLPEVCHTIDFYFHWHLDFSNY